MKKNLGFTLVEVMISLILGCAVIFMISKIYLAAEQNFSMQTSLSNLQENTQLAIKILNDEIHAAGYIGCPKLTSDFPLKNSTSFEINSENKISASAGVITVRHANFSHADLIQNMRGNSVFYTTQAPRFSAGDILIISNCNSADVCRVKKIFHEKNYQEVVSSFPLSMHYEKNSEVSRLEINTYLIAKTNRKTKTGSPLNALYQIDIHNRKTELIEGIDKMLFKLDSNAEGSIVGVNLRFMMVVPPLMKAWNSYSALRE